MTHLSYNDFRMSPARNWKEVWWIARRILLDKDGLKKRFGEEVAEKVSFTYPTTEDAQWKGDNTVQYESRAEIWEIWNKKNKTVVFVSPGYPDVLEEIQAPYALEGFFPTPEPLRLIRDPNTIIPNPEFDIYQKEAQDLSNAAERKAKLLDALQARCFVPTTFVKDVSKINTETDGAYVPLDTNADILNQNGIQSVFLYEPIEERAAVMEKLSGEMDTLTQTIYDITGRSDAMTDAGSPDEGGDETATRTKMKGKFGSLRLKKKQGMFNDYINKVYKICSEMICEMFSRPNLTGNHLCKLTYRRRETAARNGKTAKRNAGTAASAGRAGSTACRACQPEIRDLHQETYMAATPPVFERYKAAVLPLGS